MESAATLCLFVGPPAAGVALDWGWALVEAVSYGLPLAGIVVGAFVSSRWGWKVLFTSCVGWAAIGAVLFAITSPSFSATDSIAIALWFFAVPFLIGGGVARLIRSRSRRGIAAEP
jgi:hypothetical protein